ALARRLQEETSAAETAPIPLADRSLPLPLSWSQQRLWFLDQLDPAAGRAYHLAGALTLRGTLDTTALQHALDALVARHESLRTTFPLRDGQAVQHIATDARFLLESHDLRALPAAQRHRQLQQWFDEAARRPFDLVHGPLIRGQLIRMTHQQHVLSFDMHHIISDGWSIGLLVQELADHYTAALRGSTSPAIQPTPNALTVQYADYVAWQRQWLGSPQHSAQLAYWQTQLQDAPALLELPTDRPRPAVQDHHGSSLPLRLPVALSRSLARLARQHNVTLHMLLHAGLALLLSRLSGQHDIIIGTPVANRPRTEFEPIVGFFVNTLALRLRIDPDRDLPSLLHTAREQTLAAYARQDVPFEHVVDAVKPPRSMSHSPLFQVMLAWQNTPQAPIDLPDLTLAPLPRPLPVAPFDLTFNLYEADDRIQGELHYATALFDATTMTRWLGHFRQLLQAMVHHGGRPVQALPLLDQAERHELLARRNATAAPYPATRTFPQRFETQARHHPHAPAACFAGQSLDYGTLNRQANQLARRLRRLGVGPEVLVGLCVERSLAMVVGLLGILKAGGAYLPLDPGYPAERLAFMLADAQPAVLLTQQPLLERLPADDPTPRLCLDRDWPDITRERDSNLAPRETGLKPHHLAYVIYTSGSSGQPKGVMLEHRSLVNLASSQIAPLRLVAGQSRLLQFAPLSFDACIWECALALGSGAALHLARREDLIPGPALFGLLRQQHISHALLPPVALPLLAQQGQGPADLVDLHTLLVGGDVTTAAQVRQWAGTQRRLINAYGPTEATVYVSTHLCDPTDERAPPIGRPIANLRLYVLDAHRQPVPIGVSGELYIGGVGVARGYLNR
ncbi:MAG: amino acid adenylation domain-containing protein, partial [Sterolibacterium sp.]|nr:amino acid adenylation domain-containing protein [Sterolibacterium sp.]